MTTAAAIIAGGGAQRLGGVTKGLLTSMVFLVTNDPTIWADLGATVQLVADRVPAGAGPLAGIDAALAALPAAADAVVCIAGDMPFVTPSSLALLRDHAPGSDAVVARVAGHPEPLFARYARRLLPQVSAQLARGDGAVHHLLRDSALSIAWLDEPALRAVDPTLGFLENINTAAELARARGRSRQID
jgi:molybdopterin-guanine dinucleotide biosynthesis protein A